MQRGARTVEIASGDLPTEADGAAIIRFEFETNINEHFGKTPKAPVRTHDEILEKHPILPAPEQTFQAGCGDPSTPTITARLSPGTKALRARS